MKMEFSIGGKVVIIEAEGNISVQVKDEIADQARNDNPAIMPEAIAVPATVPAVPAGELFSKLVGLRKSIAEEEGVPPYVVFQDKSLHHMVERMPRDMKAFSLILGVGQAKLDKYGEKFLSLINEVSE